MKSLSVIHILFLLIAMLVCQCVHAQDYLITTKGDSVSGVLKPLLFGADKKVQVTGVDKKKTTYSMFQISSFQFKGEAYRPVKGPTGYTFMKVIKSGYLSLMAYQLENQVTYDGRYLIKKDGRGTEVPNLSFKKILTNFLSDCNEVSAKIENGDYSKRELEKIVDEYNVCIVNKTTSQKKTDQPVVKEAPIVQIDKTKLTAWEFLEQKVNEQAAFDSKDNVLEMIAEVKKKISRQEKVPNFLIQGLKESLTIPALQEDLNTAINQLNP